MRDNETNIAPANELLTENQAAEYLGLHPGTLRRWRCVGYEPQPKWVKVGRATVRYRLADLRAFIELQTKAPTPVAV